jgi:2-keto-3-deoxy-galactonokinase
MSDHTLIIDGGTTNTRITLLGPDRQALDVEKKDVGVSQTAVDGHNGQLKAVLTEAIETVLEHNHVPPVYALPDALFAKMGVTGALFIAAGGQA